jgi:hypothetical protein
LSKWHFPRNTQATTEGGKFLCSWQEKQQHAELPFVPPPPNQNRTAEQIPCWRESHSHPTASFKCGAMNCNEVTLFQRCKIILVINAFSGFGLTKCSARRRKKQWWYFLLGTIQTLYEFSLNVAIFSMTTIVGWVVLTGSNDSRGNFAAFVNSIRGILFATYITFSSLFLRFGKRQLRRILREAENITRMDASSELMQEQCLLRASQRTLNVYFLLPISTALFSIILNFTLTLMFMMGYYEDNVFDIDGDSKERMYMSIDPVKYIKILFLLIFCYLKQTAHDSIFLHIYCFTAEQLSDMKRKLKKIIRSNQEDYSPQFQHETVNSSLEKWIIQQQALAK